MLALQIIQITFKLQNKVKMYFDEKTKYIPFVVAFVNELNFFVEQFNLTRTFI